MIIRSLDTDDANDLRLISQFNSKGPMYPIQTDDTEDNDKAFIENYYQQQSVEPFLLGAIDRNGNLVGYISGSDAGYLGLYEYPGFTNKDIVFSIEVLPEARNNSVGAALMHRAREVYPDSCFIGIIDNQNINNSGVKAFYDKIGFDVSDFKNGLVLKVSPVDLSDDKTRDMIIPPFDERGDDKEFGG